MKKIILFFAEWFRVADDIRTDQTKLIGQYMYDSHYWMTGGLMYNEGLYDAANALKLYAENLMRGNMIFYGNSMSQYRDELYQNKGKYIEVSKGEQFEIYKKERRKAVIADTSTGDKLK